MANKVDATIPQNSESPTLGAQRIRETRAGFNALLTAEHDISDDATTSGFHGTNVTGKVDTAISTPPSGYGRFGWKTISGVAELFYRDDAGNEKQITSAGTLNISATEAVLLTGTQTITGVKTFGDPPIVPTPVGGTDAVNKDYLEANTGAANWTPTAYAGEESITYPNGIIMKLGEKTGTGSSVTVNFGTAFNTIVSCSFSPKGANQTNNGSTIATYSTTQLIVNLSSSNTGFFWQAWGY